MVNEGHDPAKWAGLPLPTAADPGKIPRTGDPNMRMTLSAIAAMVAMSFGLVLAADKANLLAPTNKLENWRFEQHEQGKGTAAVEGDAIVFDVTAAGGEPWHVQAVRPGLDLKEGKEYTLTYKAKGDPARTIQVNAMIDVDDWHTVGLTEDVELTKDWKEYSSTFKAEGVNAMKKNRVGFIIGGDKGKVWIKDMTLTEK
jgi:hypothetical protein